MPATANSNSTDSRRNKRMDAARNGNRRILQATRINRIHPVAPGPRRRGPLIMSTPLPGSARVTDALLTERKAAVARLRLPRPELHHAFRSEERRGGKGGGSPGKS